jgi:hypothetical protein
MKNRNASKNQSRRMLPDIELNTIPAVVNTCAGCIDPLREAIIARAYSIWQQEGCPTGRALDHWLLAEAQLGQQNPESVFSTPSAKPAIAAPGQRRRRLLDLIAMI